MMEVMCSPRVMLFFWSALDPSDLGVWASMLDVVGLLSLSDTCPDPLCTKLHKVQNCNYQFNIFIPEWNTARHFRETSILLNTSVKI